MVEHISDRVAVMYLGRIVELSGARALYKQPLHPYTKALLSVIPIAEPSRKRERIVLTGDVPSPAKPPPGCPFHPRCFMARERCKVDVPPLRELEPGHWSACHFAEELRDSKPVA